MADRDKSTAKRRDQRGVDSFVARAGPGGELGGVAPSRVDG